ncbi:Terpene cyclase 6-like protein [Cladobotryum mycophilum]|uniref:Terpene cyclase 6-like protein n=1 Tax=Cladobotryum mycophilum TaxID=491253 RepID=A0ABR0SUE8_9HYPO
MSGNATRTTRSVNEGLTSVMNRKYQMPINYVYDYLYGRSQYLVRPQLKFNDYLQSKKWLQMGTSLGKEAETTGGDHAIDLDPVSAQIPWATGIVSCRQTKHWQSCIDAAKTLLERFATDETSQLIRKSGMSIAEIARHELDYYAEDGWMRFVIYMFPGGDEQRVKLIAYLMVIIFIFDDFWEMHDINSFNMVHNEFIYRMKSGFTPTEDHRSPLILLIDQIMTEIKQLDHETGNTCGHRLLDTVLAFFLRPPPPKEYKDMDDFFFYRHQDVGSDYILACAAFSSNLSIDYNCPQLARYIRPWRDHLSVANDLGSWDKEKKAYEAGRVLYLINTVDTTKTFLKLRSNDAAVAMAYALQLQFETEMDDEIQRLIAEDCLAAEEWRFIHVSLHALTGNVFGNTVMSRYGGEKTRL